MDWANLWARQLLAKQKKLIPEFQGKQVWARLGKSKQASLNSRATVQASLVKSDQVKDANIAKAPTNTQPLKLSKHE